MKPHRLSRACLNRPCNPQLSPNNLTTQQPYLPFLYPSHSQISYSTITTLSSTTVRSLSPNDPWSFLLGRPDPSAPPPPIFNHFRPPPATPRTPFKPPSAYFPSPLSPYQQRARPPTLSTFPYSPARPPLDSTYATITERERAIFSTIFESILSESPSSLTTPSSSTLGPSRSTPTPALTALFESAVGPQFTQNKLSFGPSLIQNSPSKASSLSAAMARASAITDYPPSLRLAAAHAAGLPGIPLTESESAQEAARQSELLKTLTAMNACETDLELLEFLDTHVFSMITNPESTPSKSPSNPSKSSSSTSSQSAPKTLHIKGRKFVFPSPSYADLLLHALRLLLRTFHNLPSTLHTFHKIKSLGPESYVVGCTTSIYNLVLTARWEAYMSIQLISETLNEMRVNGIEGDRETVEVLRAVCLDALGDWRGVDENLKGMGEQEKACLARVEREMREMGEAIKEREREKEGARRRIGDIGRGAGELGLGLGLGLGKGRVKGKGGRGGGIGGGSER